MQPLVASRLAEVRRICRRFHVQRLDLFGSGAHGDFDPVRSDLDFLVDFERGAPGKALDAYFGLKEALEQLFGRPVDLVMSRAVENPYLSRSIDENREMVYAA